MIVGGGPRGTGVLERILAHESVNADPTPIDIHVVDPYPAGAGRIWRGSQAPLLWMNSTTADVTMFTDETTAVIGPVLPVRPSRNGSPSARPSLPNSQKSQQKFRRSPRRRLHRGHCRADT